MHIEILDCIEFDVVTVLQIYSQSTYFKVYIAGFLKSKVRGFLQHKKMPVFLWKHANKLKIIKLTCLDILIII